MKEKEGIPIGQWMKAAGAVGALAIAAMFYVRSTDGLTLMDQFAASIAGVICGGYLVLVVVRYFSEDEEH